MQFRKKKHILEDVMEETMQQNIRKSFLNVTQFLLAERSEVRDLDGIDDVSLEQLWRALVNIRPANQSIPVEIERDWNQILSAYKADKGIVTIDQLLLEKTKRIADTTLLLWQGDIRRLAVDGIVNAANQQFQGCFVPGHHCIDNAIQTFAGPKLRDACFEHIQKQGHVEPVGACTITPAYMLPASSILHTVGPNTSGRKYTSDDEKMLLSAYRSILECATAHEFESVAFCSISTGVFGFPIEVTSKLVTQFVETWLHENRTTLKTIVFNLFSEVDYMQYYNQLYK